MAKGCYAVFPCTRDSAIWEKGKKISGVIAKLRENSPYFVLEESCIKRDECAFVGKNCRT